MKRNTKSLVVAAAVAGIVSGAMLSTTGCSYDKAGKQSNTSMQKHDCAGKNACKGKGGCKQEANDCAGKNGCKGKGYVEKTKAECDTMAKKNKKIHFDTAGKM